MAKPTEDTGWQKAQLVNTAGGMKGLITPSTGTEVQPCFTCKAWEKDNRKLIQYLLARKLGAADAGYFETPIARDFQGRTSLKIHPRDFGYCRRQCMPTHMNASCPEWKPTLFINDLQAKITG